MIFSVNLPPLRSASLRSILLSASFLSVTLFSGCASDTGLRQLVRDQTMTIESLQAEINRLNAELDEIISSRGELEKAKQELELQLIGELASGNMSVAMDHRGLVVTVPDQILFDSGKAEIKNSALSSLAKVGDVLKEMVEDHMVYIEGHTDNLPIQNSQWRSNWELSTARATEVVHYFVEKTQLSPDRLAATGYGEFQPVASNDLEEGRMKNRRVEMIVSPRKLTELAQASAWAS